MTVNSTTSKASFSGNGSTQVFSFPYYFLTDADLTVILRTVATGAETVQTLATHYTVSGAGVSAGGSVTMLTAPATGTTLTILRTTSATQPTDFVENDALPAETLEQTLDRLAMAIQTALEVANRAIIVPRTDSASLSVSLPASVVRASKYFGFDGDGEPVALDPPTVDSSELVTVGDTAPDHENGRFWIDTGTADSLIIKISDGTTWITLGTVDITDNTFSVALDGITPAAIGAEPTITDVGTKEATATKGSASRTIAAHLSNLYDVKNYGAVGDGATDDVTAINAAITAAAAAGGGTVFFPTGTYLVSTSVLPLSDTTLMGCGPQTVIELDDTAETHTISIADSTTNVLIDNLKVDGNRAGQATQVGVGIRVGAACSDIEIRNCIVVNAKNQGIASFGTSGNGVTDFTVSNCIVDTCGSHGIYCGDDISRVLVESCTVTNWGIDIAQRPAITVGHGAGTHYRVVNNFVLTAGGTTGGGISIDQLDRGVCANNVIEGTSSWGIEIVDGADDAVVTGNKINDTDGNGIAVNGGTNGSPNRAIIDGNSITSPGDNGINIAIGTAGAGPAGLKISDNIIHAAAERGINVDETVQGSITGNIVRNCQDAGIWVEGSDNIIIANNLATNNNQSGAGEANIRVNNTAGEADMVVLGNGAGTLTVTNTVDVNTNNATSW